MAWSTLHHSGLVLTLHHSGLVLPLHHSGLANPTPQWFGQPYTTVVWSTLHAVAWSTLHHSGLPMSLIFTYLLLCGRCISPGVNWADVLVGTDAMTQASKLHSGAFTSAWANCMSKLYLGALNSAWANCTWVRLPAHELGILNWQMSLWGPTRWRKPANCTWVCLASTSASLLRCCCFTVEVLLLYRCWGFAAL